MMAEITQAYSQRELSTNKRTRRVNIKIRRYMESWMTCIGCKFPSHFYTLRQRQREKLPSTFFSPPHRTNNFFKHFVWRIFCMHFLLENKPSGNLFLILKKFLARVWYGCCGIPKYILSCGFFIARFFPLANVRTRDTHGVLFFTIHIRASGTFFLFQLFTPKKWKL